MQGSIYELAILLSLKDLASGGLGRTEAQLRSLGKEGKATLQTFQRLRESMKRDLMVAGVGVGVLTMMKRGTDIAGEYESALLDLRSAYQESAAAGALSAKDQETQMKGLGDLAVDLGNKLQGNTKTYVGILTALKQAGLPGDQVLGGAGRSAAYLANVSGALLRGQEREQAKELGQFGLMFKLRPEEFENSVNLFAALKDKFDIESGSLIESAKYFQATSNQLGITGARGAGDTVKFFALLKRQAGMEGSMAGTGARAFFMQLATEEKKLKELKKATGIELQPFDKTGTFRGYEAMFSEMEKFRKLNQQQSAKWLNKIFGERGQEVASAMVKVGLEGWKNITAESAKAVPVNEKINQQMATYNAKVEALTGSIQNLTATAFLPMVTTAKPLVDLANQVAGGLQSMASAHPGLMGVTGNLVGLAAISTTLTFGVKGLSSAWTLWKIASSVSVGQQGQLVFMRTLQKETALTATVTQAAATKVGLYRNALDRIRPAVTTTVALIGVEIAISKLAELGQKLEEIDNAKSDARGRASALGELEQTMGKSARRVPADQYREAAEKVYETVNREGDFNSALAGEGFLRGMWRFFTAQPLNPYTQSTGFSTKRAAYAIQQRGPELQYAGVMQAFLDKLTKSGLSSEQLGQAQKALELAFPESYRQAMGALSQNTSQTADAMQVLLAPLRLTADATQSLGQLGFPNLDRAATRTTSSLDILSLRLSTYQPPQITVSAGGGLSRSITDWKPIPSKASGGMVERGGMVHVHDREAIVPARVTASWRDDQPAGRTRSVVINGGIHVHLPAGSSAGVDPRELARLVAREVEIQMERA